MLWLVCSCCVTSGASPNLVSVYCLFPQTYLLGILISICGNVLISISLNIQVGGACVGMQLHRRHSALSGHSPPVKTHSSTLRQQRRGRPSPAVCSHFGRLCVFIGTSVNTHLAPDCLICRHVQRAVCRKQRKPL